MLINTLVITGLLMAACALLYFLTCLLKQHQKTSFECIEIFPIEDLYTENVYEDDKFNIAVADKCSETQMTLARNVCKVYFTADEYTKYRESVLKMKLP